MASLNPALKPFWKTRTTSDGVPVRYRNLYGGRMSSKSHDAAGIAIARSNFRTERFLCTRMYQNRIADSVYTLLKDKIYAFNLEKNFKIYADAIEHVSNGSLFRFYGMARNIDEIKSFEGATVCWIEEAHNLTENMFNILRPTIMRNEGAEFWITHNPRYVNDYVWKRFVQNPPAGTLSRLINYDENPFLTQSALDDIAAAFEEDPDLANHIYNGVPLDDSDDAIIKRSWIMASIDAHTKLNNVDLSGGVAVGYDVADGGNDANATTTMNGSICIGLDEWKGTEDELDHSAVRVMNTAKRYGALTIGYDSIGVGSGTGAHLRKAGWSPIRTFRFNAGEKVHAPERKYGMSKIKNREFFANLKAQAWWLMADRFRNTYNAVTKGYQFDASELVSIDSSRIDKKALNKLVDELSTPRRDFDSAGRVKVESKKDLAKRDVVSPNVADSFIIANSRSLLGKRPIKDML